MNKKNKTPPNVVTLGPEFVAHSRAAVSAQDLIDSINLKNSLSLRGEIESDKIRSREETSKKIENLAADLLHEVIIQPDCPDYILEPVLAALLPAMAMIHHGKDPSHSAQIIQNYIRFANDEEESRCLYNFADPASRLAYIFGQYFIEFRRSVSEVGYIQAANNEEDFWTTFVGAYFSLPGYAIILTAKMVGTIEAAIAGDFEAKPEPKLSRKAKNPKT